MRRAFTPAEWRRLGGLTAAVLALHVAGWGLVLVYAPRHPVLAGLAGLAYTFGLRHAFDADHITAIDNTTRKLLGEGQRPLATGFFFSLGHSTIVLVVSAGLALAAGALQGSIPDFQLYGGTIGAGVSGTFLWLIGMLNLVVLVGILRVAREARGGGLDEAALEARLQKRGLLSRLLGRFQRLIRRSWHMYPLGVLFGLGFDTASEVALLAVTAGAATGSVPPLAVIALPLVFAAGMSLMDTADGVFMSKAYGWAFSTPERKVFYNLSVTALSVTVALGIGTVELLQVAGERLDLRGGFWAWVEGLDFGTLGYSLVGAFAVAWVCAYAAFRARASRALADQRST